MGSRLEYSSTFIASCNEQVVHICCCRTKLGVSKISTLEGKFWGEFLVGRLQAFVGWPDWTARHTSHVFQRGEGLAGNPISYERSILPLLESS